MSEKWVIEVLVDATQEEAEALLIRLADVACEMNPTSAAGARKIVDLEAFEAGTRG